MLVNYIDEMYKNESSAGFFNIQIVSRNISPEMHQKKNNPTEFEKNEDAEEEN